MGGYRIPATNKPPSRISQLGRVVLALSTDHLLTSREIYQRAFSNVEDFTSCKATICTAQARAYVEKQWVPKKPNGFRLTAKGAAIKTALERR